MRRSPRQPGFHDGRRRRPCRAVWHRQQAWSLSFLSGCPTRMQTRGPAPKAAPVLGRSRNRGSQSAGRSRGLQSHDGGRKKTDMHGRTPDQHRANADRWLLRPVCTPVERKIGKPTQCLGARLSRALAARWRRQECVIRPATNAPAGRSVSVADAQVRRNWATGTHMEVQHEEPVTSVSPATPSTLGPASTRHRSCVCRSGSRSMDRPHRRRRRPRRYRPAHGDAVRARHGLARR